MNDIFFVAYPAAILLIALIGVKVAAKGEFRKDFLGLSTAKNIQGIAAMFIILHHLVQEISNFAAVDRGPITIFNGLGVIFTGLYFFYSGYGLYTSMEQKPDYFAHFFRNRLSTVLIPFYVNIFVSIAMIHPLDHPYSGGAGLWILYILGLVLYNHQTWYIVEICILYVAFYLIFKNEKKRAIGMIRMSAVVIIMIAVSLLLGHNRYVEWGAIWFMGEWWYNATGMFLVGLFVAINRKKVTEVAQKFYGILLPMSGFLFVVSYFVRTAVQAKHGYWTETFNNPAYDDKLIAYLSEVPMIFLFGVFIVLLTMKVQFDNRVIRFLGKHTLEIYISQIVFLTIFPHRIKSEFLFFGAVYACTILLAFFVHKLDAWLIKKVKI